MILIKLGGSIITNKERPLSARRKTIENILKHQRPKDNSSWWWLIWSLLVC